MKEMNMDGTNPKPFVQPFLILNLKTRYSFSELFIDVNGQMDDYIIDFSKIKEAMDKCPFEKRQNLSLTSAMNFISFATPKLKEMIETMRANGLNVGFVNWYIGSAGPNYLLRNGALFERIGIDKISEKIKINVKKFHSSKKCEVDSIKAAEEFVSVLFESFETK